MKYKIKLLIFLNSFIYSIQALDVFKNFSLSINGYVRFNAFLDSRQTVSSRDSDYLLYPLPVKNDKCANFSGDINAHPKFGMLAIESRLRFQAETPLINCYKINSVIEADFFGAFEGAHTMFRLRYAYLNLNNQNHNILFGQFDHPLHIDYCSPDCVSFNNGSPLELLSREPQLRYSYKNDNIEIVGAALSQTLPFVSAGPEDITATRQFNQKNNAIFSSRFIQNAIVPNLSFRSTIFYGSFLSGFCIDYKRLVPRIETDKLCKANESINSIIYEAFFAYNNEETRICSKAIYAQNPIEHGVLGGYAVSHVDPITDQRKYTNLSVFNVWLDAEKKMGNFLPGFFIGVSKNLGASEKLFFDKKNNSFITFTLPEAEKIDNVLRISPRIYWKKNQFQLAGEFEITRASFGQLTSSGKVVNQTSVTNARILFSAFYFF